MNFIGNPKKKTKSISSTDSSTISVGDLSNIIEELKTQSCRSSTMRSYYNIWRSFNRFFVWLDKKPHTWEERLVLYVGFLIQNEKKSTTVNSYISAIKTVLISHGIKISEDRSLFNALTKACKLKNDSISLKLLVHKEIIRAIIQKLDQYFAHQPYLNITYKALFSCAYYGLLRIGEVSESPHVIKACDVHRARNKKKLMFVLRSSKIAL